MRVVCTLVAVIALVVTLTTPVAVQRRTAEDPALPTARLEEASPVALAAPVDSNSPAVWTRDGSDLLLRVFASSVQPRRLTGASLRELGEAEDVTFPVRRQGGHWIEAVLPDEVGTLYAIYHHEPNDAGCGEGQKTAPYIGMAQSRDEGATWRDLGIILAEPGLACDTVNKYFVGGVGDPSALLVSADQYLYLWFTSYALPQDAQGIVAARLPWADRDAPQGHVEIWSDGAWRLTPQAGRARGSLRATPFWPGDGSWHDGDSIGAFWGPAVHWNTYLERYVMLLNRSGDHQWNQEGVYVSYAADPSKPDEWSTPTRLVEGGYWYPQVIGAGAGVGTDRLAGRRARFFMSGRSSHVIVFERP